MESSFSFSIVIRITDSLKYKWQPLGLWFVKYFNKMKTLIIYILLLLLLSGFEKLFFFFQNKISCTEELWEDFQALKLFTHYQFSCSCLEFFSGTISNLTLSLSSYKLYWKKKHLNYEINIPKLRKNDDLLIYFLSSPFYNVSKILLLFYWKLADMLWMQKRVLLRTARVWSG